MSLAEMMKKKARKAKCGQHPLAGEDADFKERYCVGVAIMAHADNEIPDSEKALFANLIEDLALPVEKAGDILAKDKPPTEDELDAVMESLRACPFTQKLAFIFDITRMMDADKKCHEDEQSVFDSFLDLLQITGKDRVLAHGLADAMTKNDSGAAVKLAMSTPFGLVLSRTLSYFISDWPLEVIEPKESISLPASEYTIQIDKYTCTGCRSCLDACPVEAISMKGGKAVVSDACVCCGACVFECPVKAITNLTKNNYTAARTTPNY